MTDDDLIQLYSQQHAQTLHRALVAEAEVLRLRSQLAEQAQAAEQVEET